MCWRWDVVTITAANETFGNECPKQVYTQASTPEFSLVLDSKSTEDRMTWIFKPPAKENPTNILVDFTKLVALPWGFRCV